MFLGKLLLALHTLSVPADSTSSLRIGPCPPYVTDVRFNDKWIAENLAGRYSVLLSTDPDRECTTFNFYKDGALNIEFVNRRREDPSVDSHTGVFTTQPTRYSRRGYMDVDMESRVELGSLPWRRQRFYPLIFTPDYEVWATCTNLIAFHSETLYVLVPETKRRNIRDVSTIVGRTVVNEDSEVDNLIVPHNDRTASDSTASGQHQESSIFGANTTNSTSVASNSTTVSAILQPSATVTRKQQEVLKPAHVASYPLSDTGHAQQTGAVSQQQPVSNTAAVSQQQPVSDTAAVSQQQPVSNTATVNQQQPVSDTATVNHQQPVSNTAAVSQQQPVSNTATVSQQQPVSATASVIQQQPVSDTASVIQQQPVSNTTAVSQQQPVSDTATVNHQQPVSNTATVSQQQPVSDSGAGSPGTSLSNKGPVSLSPHTSIRDTGMPSLSLASPVVGLRQEEIIRHSLGDAIKRDLTEKGFPKVNKLYIKYRLCT